MPPDLSASLAVLSAMITPAVLISACGALTISTSNRLGRVIDRTRKVSDRFVEVAALHSGELLEDQRAELFRQLGFSTRRTRLLQRALASLYLALSVFVATSVAIGIVSVATRHLAWIPILLGLAGAALLFYTSLLLIADSRIAMDAIADEMDYVTRLGRHYATEELLQVQKAGRRKTDRVL